MKSQYNFQMKPRNDKREWEQVEIFSKMECDRTTAIQYARNISKKLNTEIRLTQGTEPFKTSGTYIYENQ